MTRSEAESVFRKLCPKFPPFTISDSLFSFLCCLPKVDFLRRHFKGFLNLDDKISHKFPVNSTKHSKVFRTSLNYD